MKRALIKDLHTVAKERSEGYLEACLRAGKISRDGQWMIFDDAAHTKLRLGFRLSAQEPPLPKRRVMVKHISAAAWRQAIAIARGQPTHRTEEEKNRVQRICTGDESKGIPACGHYRPSDTRCAACGCFGQGGPIGGHWALATEHCALKPPKW